MEMPVQQFLPVTGGFPSQGASNAESISMLWRHHVMEMPVQQFFPSGTETQG